MIAAAEDPEEVRAAAAWACTGNRVLLRGPNSPELVAGWLGVLMAGGVVVATMPALRPGELRAIGEITRPQLALCDARFTDDLAAGLPDLRIVRYGDGDLRVPAERHRAPFAPVPTSADDVALLAVTSGTTGVPKATVHFHRDVLAIADTFSRHVLRPTADDLFLGQPAARLHLRARRRGGLPAAGRRREPAGREAHARRARPP